MPPAVYPAKATSAESYGSVAPTGPRRSIVVFVTLGLKFFARGMLSVSAVV